MVFVVLDVEREELHDIAGRLLGTKYQQFTVVDHLSVACGCQRRTQPASDLSQPPAPQSFLGNAPFSCSSLEYNSMDNGTVHTNTNNESGEDFATSGIIRPDAVQFNINELVSPSADYNATANGTALVIENGEVPCDLYSFTEMKPSAWLPDGECSAFKRNNGVPYHRFTTPKPSSSDDPVKLFPEGTNLCIKCAICDATVALGTRPANYSTRKYAHARRHGFLNRFECNLCHEMLKSKRAGNNHNKMAHAKDPAFQLVDRWNLDAQKELAQMVQKCFPKETMPFVKGTDDVEGGDEENDANETMEDEASPKKRKIAEESEI